MATQPLDQEIATRIQSFLGELSALVKKQALEAVHSALATDGAPVRRGPGRPRKVTMRVRAGGRPAKGGRRIRRSAADLEKIAARVLAAVRSKQGQRLEEIGRAMKTDTGILKRPIANLLAAKKLKTKGAKRGTRYFTK